MTDWTTDSNDALRLSMVRTTSGSETLTDQYSSEFFHPTFTYPIYGEEEKIYGYKDLLIDLRFSSGSLAQYLNVRYSQKLPSSTVDDVEGTLSKFIPPGYHQDEAAFLRQVEEDSLSFRPHGESIYSYPPPLDSLSLGKETAIDSEDTHPEGEGAITYEVYHVRSSTWDTPGFREYHSRLQLFVLLYIEGGSYINEDEEPWEFMVLYEKRKRKESSTYHLVGYSSLYNFYHFPEKVRMRLSQFVILPLYQRQGHGSELYKAIYRYILSQPRIAELTVEDPAEAFEDLRDKNDLRMLFSHRQFMKEGFGEHAISYSGGRVGGIGKAKKSGRGGFTASVVTGKLGPPTDKAWAEKWRRDLKLAGRQFHRLVEMLILSRLDPLNAFAIKPYRLQVKERLYRFNYEILAQLEKQERLEKLEETFQGVQADYQRILRMAGFL
ncbi:Acyl-CoA N-acyltransferase [Amanita muscaria]